MVINPLLVFVKLIVIALLFAIMSVVAQGAEQNPAKPVEVDQVSKIDLAPTTELNATLYSRSHIPVTAGVNGRLEFIAQPGDYVHQGEPLVTMDLLPLELKQAEQQAKIKREKINLAYLKKEFSRLEQLSETKATSQYLLDQTRSKYDLAKTDLDIAQLKLQQINDQLNRAIVTAPFSGVITERMVRVGTDVSRGDQLLKLLDTEHLEARLYIPIKYLAYVNKGDRLSLSASGKEIKAVISAKIPRADPRSQTFEVRLKIPQSLNNFWAAGQLVRVVVPTQQAKETLTVHRDALILRKTGTYVVKVQANKKVKRLLVTVGQGNKERVSIVGPLEAGDDVAIRGAERLEDGETVVIQ